ncbi:hypothetical protein F5X68DRAFT_235846 [Plectosphaerella plurivora]|uniref:Uncharacterized protein n=1 Tax=Plectosphaerella plurivora TaxID=936078 RepID=A0A9P9A534_9PEZI|nr:hypothetical protein F5X68DRAFT_235846 [Plectosphaerella plurivora]
MDRFWDFEDFTFDKWLEDQANAANKGIGKATTNSPVWGTPGASHRYDSDDKINKELADMWENARDSQLFRQVVPQFLLASVDDEMSLPGHFSRFRRSLMVSTLPASERLRRHNNTVTYILYLVQSVPCGCPMPRRMVAHPDYRKLIVLRDLVAVPNQLSPMLTYPAGHDKLSRNVLNPGGVALRDDGLRSAKLDSTDTPLDTIQVAPIRMGNTSNTGLLTHRKESSSQLNTLSADKNDDITALDSAESPMSASSLPKTSTLQKRKYASGRLPRSLNTLLTGGLRPVDSLHSSFRQEKPSAKDSARPSSAQPALPAQPAPISFAATPSAVENARSTSLQPGPSTVNAALASPKLGASLDASKSLNTKSTARETIGPSAMKQVPSSQLIKQAVTEPAASRSKVLAPPLLMIRREPDPIQIVSDVMVQIAAIGLAIRMDPAKMSRQHLETLSQQAAAQDVSDKDRILAMGRELQATLPSALEAYRTAIRDSQPWQSCQENLRRVLIAALLRVYRGAPTILPTLDGITAGSQPSTSPVPTTTLGQGLPLRGPVPSKIATIEDLQCILDPHLGKMHQTIKTVQEAQKTADDASHVQVNQLEALRTDFAESESKLREQIVKHTQLYRSLTFFNQRMHGADQNILRHETEIKNLSQKTSEFFVREAEIIHNLNRHAEVCNTLGGKIKGQEETIKAQDGTIKSQDARLKALEQRLAAQDQKIAEMMQRRV